MIRSKQIKEDDNLESQELEAIHKRIEKLREQGWEKQAELLEKQCLSTDKGRQVINGQGNMMQVLEYRYPCSVSDPMNFRDVVLADNIIELINEEFRKMEVNSQLKISIIFEKKKYEGMVLLRKNDSYASDYEILFYGYLLTGTKLAYNEITMREDIQKDFLYKAGEAIAEIKQILDFYEVQVVREAEKFFIRGRYSDGIKVNLREYSNFINIY